MENSKEDRLSMYQKTIGYLNLHQDEINEIPSAVSLKIDFEICVSSILELASASGSDITGFTVDKQAKRTALKDKLLIVSTAVVAYSAVNENFSLLEKCDESPAAMDAMRDNDFYTYAKLVINEATPILLDLAPFKLDKAKLAEANAAADNYLNVIQSPRVQISERSTALLELESIFENTENLLNNKLDKVMGIFLATNPVLYSGYLSSRSIDNVGSSINADYEGTINAGVLHLIAEIPYLSGRTFDFKNTSKVALSFALSTNPDAMEGIMVIVNPESSVTRKTSNLNNDPKASKLYVMNNESVLSGEYKVYVTE